MRYTPTDTDTRAGADTPWPPLARSTVLAAAPGDVLAISLLGGFTVSIGDRPIAMGLLRARRAGEVVALLALAPGRRMRRDDILATLWPRQRPAAAQAALYRALHVARQGLAASRRTGPWLRSERDEVLLGEPHAVQVDAVVFETAANAALRAGQPDALAAAEALYTGNLWPASVEEPWVERQRARLMNLHTTLLRRLVTISREQGDEEQALRQSERIASRDPYDEATFRTRLELLTRLGRRSEAIARFHRFARRLQRELDVEPEPLTRQLYADIAAGVIGSRETPTPPRDGTGGTGAPGNPVADTAVPSLAARPGPTLVSSVPRPLTSLLGRDEEVGAIVDGIAGGARLVSVTGLGGVGKTRVALAAAAALEARFANGALFVDLAPLRDPRQVLPTLAARLGVIVSGADEPIAPLAAALKDRHLLIVLDNYEQLIEAARDVVGLLEHCPDIVALVTSRERLHVRGEREIVLHPLPVPDRHEHDAARILNCVSAALFLERARVVRPDLNLTPTAVEGIAEICRLVEGIPLALELAAARLRFRTPEMLAAELERRLPALIGGPRDAPERQHTLKATLAWSHALLEPPEQTLLRRLSVFVGGATIAAIEAVCGADLVPNLEGSLTRLADHHLVMIDAGGASVSGHLETPGEAAGSS